MVKYKFFDRKIQKIINNLEEYSFFFNKGNRYIKGIFDTKLLKGIVDRKLYKDFKKYKKCIAIHHVPCHIEEGKRIGDIYAYHNIYCFYNENVYKNSAIGLLEIEKTYECDGNSYSLKFEGLDCNVHIVEFRYNQQEFDRNNIVARAYYSDFFSEHRKDINYYSTQYWRCCVENIQDDGNVCTVKLNIIHEQKTIASPSVFVELVSNELNERRINITELQNTIAEDEAPFIAKYIEFLVFGYQKKDNAILTIKQPF